MANGLTLEVSRDGLTGRLQVSINKADENGILGGHRLLGPKFNGTGETLASAEIDRYDADAIRGYLDEIFPKN